VPAIPRVRLIQLPAIAALPLSASGHGRLQNRDTHVALATGRRPKKTQEKKTENSGRRPAILRGLKKIQLKKTPFSDRPIYHTFRTALTLWPCMSGCLIHGAPERPIASPSMDTSAGLL